MAEDIPPLNLYRGKPWVEWITVVEKNPNILSEKVERNTQSVFLLPRKDILLYGCCPKMDVRVLCQCEKCGKVVMPSTFVSHSREKHGSEQTPNSPVIAPGTSLLKKKYSHWKNKKKTILPPPVPPPPLFPKQATPPASPIAAPVELPPASIVTPPSTPPLPSTANNPRHKKSKKSNKKVKEYDPDKHCGVVEGHKGPCLRSITCSNHMVHLRKAVPGRSKDFQQLIADHKAAKDKETNKISQVPTLPKVETTTTTTTSQNTNFITTATPPTFVNIAPDIQITPQDIETLTQDIEALSQDIQVVSQPLHVTDSSSTVSSSSSSQGNLENSSSVVYMPMSPVAVVSPVQLGGPMLRVASTQPVFSPPLATQPIVVTIPVQNNNMPMYTNHPKPLIMSTCSTRKIGGTFVLQNDRLDHQRSEIQLAANTRRSITNACSLLNTHHHKPNILKNSMRGSNIKVSAVKRHANDKIINENKHIRFNDVNGFILHADVSEAAEAPHSNNSVHEKVTFINMK